MSPEEKHLLERAVKLSEENNQILRGIRSTTRWHFVWGVIKIAIFIVPLVIGYLYLEPYLGTLQDSLKQAQQLLGGY